jgi:ABC-type Fe3+/spermidine/putrescine transport system ATPase subunit
MTRVTLDRLTKAYTAAGHPAVDHLSLEIEPGEIVALLGPSGCGKTTTLKMIAGLLDPSEGDVLFDGQSVRGVPAEKRNSVMVFQEHALFPFMSVGQNVGFGLQVRGVERKQIEKKVDEMLELVQLPGIARRRPQELSGGQRQRVALARALVTEPKLLLLDEPLANLDAHLRDEMRALILDIQDRTGITTVIVTHDQQEAVLLADRIALMFDGVLQHYDEPIELFQHPLNEREARFFGGLNFIPAVRKGNIAETPIGDFRLDGESLPRMPEGEATLTIRPEHIRVGVPPGPNAVTGTLFLCIFIGTHTRCMVRIGTHEIEAMKGIDSTMLDEGGEITIGFPSEHIWLFPRRPPV